MRPGQSTALLYAGSEKRAAPTATPGVFWARFGPFCGALRDILRIYGFEGDARGQGEAFTRICESTFRRLVGQLGGCQWRSLAGSEALGAIEAAIEATRLPAITPPRVGARS